MKRSIKYPISLTRTQVQNLLDENPSRIYVPIDLPAAPKSICADIKDIIISVDENMDVAGQWDVKYGYPDPNSPWFEGSIELHCPFMGTGCTLWVRERWAEIASPLPGRTFVYEVDGDVRELCDESNQTRRISPNEYNIDLGTNISWQHPDKLPRYASRIEIIIKDIKAVQFGDIRAVDAFCTKHFTPTTDASVLDQFRSDFVHDYPDTDASTYLWQIDIYDVVIIA